MSFKDLSKIEDSLNKEKHQKNSKISSLMDNQTLEFTCFNDIINMTKNLSISISDFLKRVSEHIPNAWQHPDCIGVKILSNNQEFIHNFKGESLILEKKISIAQKEIGLIEIHYYCDKTKINKHSNTIFKNCFLTTVSVIIANYIQNYNSIKDLIREKTKYKMMVENIGEGILLEDTNGVIQFVNPSYMKMVDYSEEELLGKHYSITVPPDLLEKVANETSKKPIGVKSKYTAKNISRGGTIIPLIVNACPIYSKTGEFEGVLSVLTDITNQKEIEEELRKAKERYQTLIEQMGEGVALENTDGIITFINPRITEMSGYSEEEIIGKHWSKLVPPEFLQKVENETRRRQKGIASTYETAFLTKDKRCIPVVATASPIISDLEGFSGVLTVFTEIAEQKKIEKALRDAKEKYQMLMESMQEGVLFINNTGNLTFINPRAAEMYGYSTDILLEKPLSGLFSVEDLIPIEENWGNYHLAKRYNRETSISTKNGKQIPVIINSIPIYSSEKEFQGVLIVLTDITEQKRYQLLQEAFISSTNHELRTPVTVIKGYIDFLKRHPNIPEDKKTHIYRKLSSNILRLTGLLNDVHDLTRITRDIFTIHREIIDVDDLIMTIQEQLKILYPKRAIILNFITETGEREISVDRERILQVIFNLTDNAIKNSPKDSIINITIGRTQNYMTLAVQDSGSGIPMETLPRLFKPFSRADTKYSTKGTGLGLFIVKSIIFSHNGQIEMQTQENYGTIFLVEIPT